MKINNFLKLGILLFGISIFLWNCEKQENIPQQKQTVLENILSKFNPTDFKKAIPYDYTVDWNNTNKLYSEELKSYYYEFPISYNSALNPAVLKKS